MTRPTSTNSNSYPCKNISSHCVVWQGPDIPCIDLCNGDSISAVVYKIAEQLCTVIDTFSLQEVDLSCLALSEAPISNVELIQALVDKLCYFNENCCSSTPGSTSPVIVPLPECLQYDVGPTAIVELPIDEYAEYLAITICSMITDITALQTAVTTLQGQMTSALADISDHETRIISLEGKDSVTFIEVDGGGTKDIDNAVEALEEEFVDLRNCIGLCEDINSTIDKEFDTNVSTTNLNSTDSLARPGIKLSAISGWIANPSNLAESMNNVWITLRDMRDAVINTVECCAGDCSDIHIYLNADSTGTTVSINSLTTSDIPSTFIDCGTSSTLTIYDTLNLTTYQTTVSSVTSFVNNGNIISVDLNGTGLSTSSDLIITLDYCLKNTVTNVFCNNTVTFNLNNSILCPAIVLTPSWTTSGEIDYSFVNEYASDPSIKYRVLLLDSGLAQVSYTDHIATSSPDPVIGTFTGLSAGDYTVQIQVYTLATGSIYLLSRTCTGATTTVTNSGACENPTIVTVYDIEL